MPAGELRRTEHVMGMPVTAIVRDPAAAPPGTSLRVRVAGGELPATADER